MLEALSFEFMQNALLAGLLVSIACGVIGALVVINRMVLISGGIAHSAYGGIGIAIFFGISPMLGATLFSTFVAIFIALITLKETNRSDTIIAVFWALGMAIGIIFIDLTSGYSANLMSYLFGSILSVPKSDIYIMTLHNIVILALVAFFYKEFLAMSYDREFATLRGVPVKFLYTLLLVMVAQTVVMTIQVVGLILVIALLTIPVYIAEKFSKSLFKMMIISSILGFIFTLIGLYFSYTFNITSGASIIAVASVVFFVSIFWERVKTS